MIRLAILAIVVTAGLIARSHAQSLPAPQFTTQPASTNNATAATTAFVAGAVASAAGLSVVEKGAACDGRTDDTLAISAALNSGATRVTLPPGATCYSSTGITVPSGVTLAGLSFTPGNPPTGSEILCAANVAKCVNVGTGGGLYSARVETLVIATKAVSAATAGACLYVAGAYNVTIEKVMVYNCYDGYTWGSHTLGGLGGKMREVYSGKIADAHVLFDSWAELKIENSRLGMNGLGDISGAVYMRITGGTGGGSGSGPNTLYVMNTQFNQGGAAPTAAWLQFTNYVSNSNATEFQFIGNHVENVSGAFITSDSTWSTIAYLTLIGNHIVTQTTPFWALDPATSLSDDLIIGNFINTSTFTLAPATNQFNDTVFSGNAFGTPVSISSGSSGSSLVWSDNTVLGNLTFAGPWTALACNGGEVRGGSLSVSGATGTISNTCAAGSATYSGNAAFNGGNISLNNGTSNTVIVGGAGAGAPTFTTSSAGEKVIFYANESASTVDYAMGIGSGSLWSSVGNSSGTFNWYGGTALVASLTGAGLFSPAAGVQLPATTVASLPPCGSGQKGLMYSVSDATTPTYNGALTGGGAVAVPAYCNGAAWTAH